MRAIHHIASWTLALTLTLGPAPASAAPATAAGVYTEAQAQAGAVVYATHCAFCHGRGGEGSWEVPALTGRFLANWRGASVGTLSAYIGRAMPQHAPGALDGRERTDVVAHLLKLNGQAAGPVPLPQDPAVQAGMPLVPATRPSAR